MFFHFLLLPVIHMWSLPIHTRSLYFFTQILLSHSWSLFVPHTLPFSFLLSLKASTIGLLSISHHRFSSSSARQRSHLLNLKIIFDYWRWENSPSFTFSSPYHFDFRVLIHATIFSYLFCVVHGSRGLKEQGEKAWCGYSSLAKFYTWKWGGGWVPSMVVWVDLVSLVF